MAPVCLSASRHGLCLPVWSLPVLCVYVFVCLFVQGFLTVSAPQYNHEALLSIRTAVDYYAHKRASPQRPGLCSCFALLLKADKEVSEKARKASWCKSEDHRPHSPATSLSGSIGGSLCLSCTAYTQGIGHHNLRHLLHRSWTPEHVLTPRKIKIKIKIQLNLNGLGKCKVSHK